MTASDALRLQLCIHYLFSLFHIHVVLGKDGLEKRKKTDA